ncbi:Imm1 family immunity protein [Actinokineospora cianjurensis]|uniref:Immunity protein Imm1 of predicted polymorphic toxin system n=1 Tax=Actinokineospora cianjurensis TaxID=585224 RepID=A0A421AXP8_9PSEU|nr:Imm1 family immunity protein [Actinokineospora cianjurensis]RLK54596.1 immunity protein Imm1 of predicted polymorphic toxin system [Actinokineospora cianjurensis]
MIAIRAYFEDGDPVVLRTPDDVIALMDRVQAESREYDLPLFMQWYVDGDSDALEFGVGVNNDLGALTFSGGSWPGLWFSQGDGAGDELLSYDYMSHERPVPARSEIPFEDVRRAALEFLATGDRPSSIEWIAMHGKAT